MKYIRHNEYLIYLQRFSQGWLNFLLQSFPSEMSPHFPSSPSVSSLLNDHISCIVAIPHLRSMKTGCALHLWGTFYHVKGNFVRCYPEQMWPQSVTLVISLTGTDNCRSRAHRFCSSPSRFSIDHSHSAPRFTMVSNLGLVCSHWGTLFSGR